MKKRIIGYSLISAVCFGSTAVDVEAKDVSRMTKLEAQICKERQEGRDDPELLKQLALVYYENRQYAKGRDIFNQMVSLYKHDKSTDAYVKVASTMSCWAYAESIYARDFNEAERLNLRALKLWDKPPANAQERIEAHRSMIRFYRFWGKEKEANLQTQELAKLTGKAEINTSSPLPRWTYRYCPACGRG